ncbi:MAG: hypothetical protein HZA19_00885 [Nitrospirae bacterium]|nr:hypothetical protein [Nitrospirota bacterium]
MTDFLIKTLKGLAVLLWGNCLTRAKIRGAVYYLQGVRTARRFFVLLSLAAVSIAVLAVGLALLPVAVYLYLPWAPGSKGVVILLFGIAYVAVPLIVLSRLLSEKYWMEFSRADKILEKVTKEP